jgi:hypothetical protein
VSAGNAGAYRAVPPSDAAILDRLTAYLNGTSEPSGADVVQLLCELLAASGRPLLAETWDFAAIVDEDRHGVPSAVVNAGPCTVRVTQPTSGPGDLTIAVTSNHADSGEHDSSGLAVTVDGRTVLHPATEPAAPHQHR